MSQVCTDGGSARLYLDTSWTSPGDMPAPLALTLIPRIGDITMPLDGTEINVDAREVRASLIINGKINFGIDAQYNHILGTDAMRTTLLDSKLNNTPLLLYYLDQEWTVTGAKGFRGIYVVTAFGHDAPQDDRLGGQLSFRPTCGLDSGNELIPPEAYTIT